MTDRVERETVTSIPLLSGYTPEHRMLIDGALTTSSSGQEFDNINPATEQVLGSVADGSVEDMHRAIASARRAFDDTDWSTNHDFRKKCLEQLQAGLVAERELFRVELVDEVGCPVSATYGAHLDGPLNGALTWPTQFIDKFQWEQSLGDKEGYGGFSERVVRKEPVGVVGAIIPWNAPVEVTLSKLGPILATGNTVIIKPAPDTPWNATRLGRIIAESTDIPAGVVNIVTSANHLLGEELTLDKRVDMISFTGSTATGKRIMEKGAATLKRVFLELGGKSALIVCDDADFSAVLPMATQACYHAGQGCSILTRYLLPRHRYQEGVEIIKDAFSQVRYGDPRDPQNIQGPQISKLQRTRVLDLIQKGIDEGATLELGGGRPAHLQTGWFVEPTLFSNVENSMTIAQREVFGPVAVVIPYDDDEHAIRIANDSEYGLSGGVVSGNLDRAKSIARRIRSGTMAVNGGNYFSADVPFGGYKSSGIGRQGGIEGFNQYLETKLMAWPAS